ncbi:MAG: domain containing protein [Verrucomicrobiales bacterium]|nr:domain containing protein [Verrucomicrobiales bacterium]
MNNSSLKNKWRWGIAVLLICATGIAGLALWLGGAAFLNQDPIFHGKPESEWIRNLKYSDDQQVKEWKSYREEGVQVLIRGLQKATHPGERAYRRLNRHLPALLRAWLPPPKQDSTQATRECLVSLLWSLGSDARSAASVMIGTVINDESDGVRQSAIGYFNSSGDENSPLNRLTAEEKKELLPGLIRAIQDTGNWGLRNNAALTLKYYPEQREVVGPVLVKALQDSQPYVRLYAAEALNRVDPDAAKNAGATSLLITTSKDSDDQVASKAVAALGHAGSQPDLAVPALVDCLQSTNTLIGCEAVWALEWAPKEFNGYSDTIIAALANSVQRKDDVGGYAKAALARWKAKGAVSGIRNHR